MTRSDLYIYKNGKYSDMEMCSKLKQNLMSGAFKIKHLSALLHVGRLLMSIIFIFAINAASAQGSQSTCDAQPAFSGSLATLTCTFPENLADSNFNVVVNHYVKDISLNEIVLLCKSSNGTFSCSGVPDYHFIKYEKDSVTGKCKLIAQISEVNHRHAGKYCCDFSWFGDDRENQCQECILEVQVFLENLSTTENYRIKEITENDASSLIFPLTVALGIIFSLGSIVTIIIVILKYVLKKRRKKTEVEVGAESPNAGVNGSLLNPDKTNPKTQSEEIT